MTNILKIPDAPVYLDKNTGEKFIQDEFWYDEEKNCVFFRYTNGRVFTEEEQNRLLINEEKFLIDKNFKFPSVKHDPTVKENLLLSRPELFDNNKQANEEYFTGGTAPVSIEFDNNFENEKLKELETKKLNKIKKFIDQFGEIKSIKINIDYKTLNEQQLAMLFVAVDDIDYEQVTNLIFEAIIEKVKNNIWDKIVPKNKSIYTK